MTRSLLPALVWIVAASSACARSSGPPPQTAADPPPYDAGLPPPPPSTKRGVIVPADMGLGAGASGLTPSSGATSPVSPPAGGPPSIGN